MALSQEIISLLRDRQGMLCSVESCTGGLIASLVTDIAGASDVFWGSLVTYDNSAKVRLANVPPFLLEEFGAISRQTAIAMAEGGLEKMREALSGRAAGSENLFAVATTGIAGPAGGTIETPVGLCWLALAQGGAPTVVREIRGNPQLSRQELKAYFAEEALRLILEGIKK